MAGIDPHPAVKAISPQAPMIDVWMGDDFFHNGAFRQTYGYDYVMGLESSKEDTEVSYGKGKDGYLFNHKALASVFRAKLLAGLKVAGLTLPNRYPTEWVVDCKSVGSGEPALIYLGRYLYRGVIREKDIVSCTDGRVGFRYQNAKTGHMEQRTASGPEFLWLVLQHVLPKGFRRARNFGFLHPNCKRLIALLHVLLKFVPGRSMLGVKERPPIRCSCCGAVMVIVKTRIRSAFSGSAPAPIATEAKR